MLQERDYVIRAASTKDLDQIQQIYESARAFMKETGNPTQWPDGYPPLHMLKKDIDLKELYVVDAKGQITGVFAMIFGEDETYTSIDGKWISMEPYAALHRVAGKSGCGTFEKMLEYAKGRIDHLRIDTHPDNTVMQKLIERSGFKKTGIIYLQQAIKEDPRIAYEWVQSGEGK